MNREHKGKDLSKMSNEKERKAALVDSNVSDSNLELLVTMESRYVVFKTIS